MPEGCNPLGTTGAAFVCVLPNPPPTRHAICAVGCEELGDRVRRKSSGAPGGSAAIVEQDIGGGVDRGTPRERVVYAPGRRVLEEQVDRDVEEKQADDDQRHDADQQTAAERECHFLGVRRTYPTPRTVWISGGSYRSTFRRK